MKIGITYDLKDDYLKEGFTEEQAAEFDRASTIDSINDSLKALGHTTELIGNIKALVKALSIGKKWDLVFNICEGYYGKYSRESSVPALLEAYNIPYTFSDPIMQGISLKKDLTKIVAGYFNIKTPDFSVIKNKADIKDIKFKLPLFIKPIAEGTSKGISDKSKVHNYEELEKNTLNLLEKYKQPVLVETFCSGREFTAGLTGTGAKTEYIGALEIILNQKAEQNAYSYLNKEKCEELVDYKTVSNGELNERIKKMAINIWQSLEFRDAGRIDFMLDENNDLNFIEANPLAGLHPEHSDLPILFNKLNIPYIELIKKIVASASERI